MTVLDYRKLLIDIQGVRNAWLECVADAEFPVYLDCGAKTEDSCNGTKNRPCLTANPDIDPTIETTCSDGPIRNTIQPKIPINGLYKVWLELDPVRPSDKNDKQYGEDNSSFSRILDEAWKRLRSHRNLCEDFAGISILQQEQIALCAAIEIAPEENIEDVLTEMFINLRNFLSPPIRFYSFKELKEKGRSTEDIFEGRPILEKNHGFIDTEEFEKREQLIELHVSDFYQVMLDTSGLRAITSLKIINYIDGAPQSAGAEWLLKLTNGFHPTISAELSKLVVLKDGVPFGFNIDNVIERVAARLTDQEKSMRQHDDLDLSAEEGKFIPGLGDYYSIQNDFPAIYGIKEGGLPKNASKKRKAQAYQLKAYLLFFDQLLAGYLSQLGRARSAFSLSPTGAVPLPPADLGTVPDLPLLIRGADPLPEGDPITGSDILYRFGATVLFPYDGANEGPFYKGYFFFNTPTARESALEQIQNAFENNEFKIVVLKDECGDFIFESHFNLELPSGHVDLALRGKTSFKTEDAAFREAESLAFLGLQRENFKKVDRQKDAHYTFEIAYQPRKYNDFVQSISEPGNTALHRRDRFLNHLLARFNEDFTEYALLAFAAGKDSNKSKEDLRDLVNDKEQFLANYDRISRNRGKGFDHTNGQQLWGSDNVSGLETRAAGLMGIEQWGRRTLAPFSVEGRPVKKPWLLKDFRDRILLQTVREHASDPQPGDNAALIEMGQIALANGGFQPIDCNDYGAFGFKLVKDPYTPEPCKLAFHPYTYGSKTLRDSKAHHLLEMFRGDGLHKEIEEIPVGWVFRLCESDGPASKVVLESAVAAATEPGVLLQWVQVRNRGLLFSNWRFIEEPLGEGYSFALLGMDGGDLALHPYFYNEKKEAELALEKVMAQLSSNLLDARLLQRPSIFTWQLKDGDGNILLENLYPFATQEQASISFCRALDLAAEEQNYEIWENGETGEFTFFLVQSYPPDGGEPGFDLRIAAHPNSYGSEEELNPALIETVGVAQTEASFTGIILPKNNAMRYRLCNEDGETIFNGIPISPDIGAVDAAWAAFLKIASLKSNYRIDKEEGIVVWIDDGCGRPLAISPCSFSSLEAAQTFISDTAFYVLKEQPAFKTDLLDSAYTFRLFGPNGKPAMVGQAWYETSKKAKAAYLLALNAALIPENWKALDAPGICKIQLMGAAVPCDEPLALSIENFADLKKRNDCLIAWKGHYQNSDFRTCLLECAGNWYIEIWKDCSLALTSSIDFTSETEAAVALEKMILVGCGEENFVKKFDGCQIFFDLVDPGTATTLATHRLWYLDPLEVEQVVKKLSDCLCQAMLPVKFEFRDASYFWKVIWETCDERLMFALVETAGHPTKEEAVEACGAALINAANNLVVEDGPQGNGPYGIVLQINGTTTAVHPETYTEKEERDEVLEDLKKYLNKTNWELQGGGNGQEKLFFQTDKPETVAIFGERFSEKANRDYAMKALLEMLECRTPEYSSIDFGEGVVFESGGQFYFRLKTGKKVLWQSINSYGTREEALKAFQNEFLNIIYNATDPDFYKSECDGNEVCWFWLLDANENPIAKTPPFLSGEEPKEVFEFRQRHALTYPVFLSSDRFCFQLFDPPQNKRLFSSTLDFPTHDEALDAFDHFIQLLCFESNIQPVDNLLACWFSIEVVEAGLDGIVPYENYVAEEEEISLGFVPEENKNEMLAWGRLDSYLSSYKDTNHIFHRFDPLKDCRFRVFWAEDEWVLANHCQYYHSPAQREMAIDQLFHRLCCDGNLFDGKFCGGYFLKDSLCLPFQKDFGIWAITEHVSTELLNKVGNSHGVPSIAKDDLALPEVVMDLMEYARSEDFYVMVAEQAPAECLPGEALPMNYRLGLMNDGNELIALGTALHANEDAWKKERDRAIEQAWRFPIVRRQKRFGFQVAIDAEILFENTHNQENFLNAWNGFLRFKELICDKRNYGRPESEDCGPFGIVINDPKAIIAEHPAAYSCRSELTPVLERLAFCLDSKGMHLMEHLLLRPRSAADCLMPLPCFTIEDCKKLEKEREKRKEDCRIKEADYLKQLKGCRRKIADCKRTGGDCKKMEEACKKIEEKYRTLKENCKNTDFEEAVLCGADPYSFQATVVIPYWAKQFRKLDFRAFFEKTLRQEAPAHVALRIIWLDVLSMKRFETYYREWLVSHALGEEACTRQDALCRLIKELNRLKNTYPKTTRLPGGLDETDLVILDNSSLGQ